MQRYFIGLFALCLMQSVSASALTLTEAVSAGLGNSQPLLAARQNYIMVRQGLITASAGLDAGVDVSISKNKAKTDSAVVSGGFRDSDSQSGSITLKKRLADFGEAAAKRKLAGHSLDSAAANYRLTRQRTILEIISASLTLETSAEQLALRLSNLERLEAQTEAARVRLDAGTSTPTILAQAEARRARALADQIAAETALQEARQNFTSLTGLPAADLQIPDLPLGLPGSLADAEALAVADHPSVEAAKAGERSADAQFDVLTGTVMPKLNFSLSASTTDREGRNQDKEEITAGITLSGPLLVTRSTRAKSREAVANLNKARHNLAEAERKARLNAGNAWRNWQAATAQLAAVESEVIAAELAAEGTAAEVEFGLKTFLDGLDADNALNDARLRALQTRQSVLLRAYQLQEAVGGLTPAALGIEGAQEPENIADPEPYFTGMLPFGSKTR